jgi:hypothetical protein
MRNDSRTTLQEMQQAVLFEIANGNSCQVCSLRTKFPPSIRLLVISVGTGTRSREWREDCLAKERFEDGRINLVMI